MNRNTMYQDGGNQMQQIYQMLVQKGFQMPFEQFQQLPPEQIQQLAQQAQGPQQAQNGRYSTTGVNDVQAFNPNQFQLEDTQLDSLGEPIANVDNPRLNAGRQRSNSNAAVGNTVGNIAAQAGMAGAGVAEKAISTGGNEQGAGAIGKKMLNRTGQGAALGASFGPWGALIGAGVGAIAGGVEGGVQADQYRNNLLDSQQAENVGSLGNSLNIAANGGYYFKKGGYTRQASAERAYARSLANQSYGNARVSNKLGLNSKIYAAGSKIKKAKGGHSVWMTDDTKAKSYADGGQNASMEAEGGEVVLGDMGKTQTYDGTGIKNQSSAGGVIKGPDHGQKNSGGSKGVPMDAPNAYIGSKRKTVDGKDIKVKKNAPAPANSVAGKMGKILKDIEKIEKSNDRYVNNPVVIEKKKQELAKLRDLAELGKMNREMSKLVKQGDSEGARQLMGQSMNQQQAGQQNNMAMSAQGGYYAHGGSTYPPYYPANIAPAANGGYYQQGGMVPTQMMPAPQMMPSEGRNRLQQNLDSKRYTAQMNRYNQGQAQAAQGLERQLAAQDAQGLQNYMSAFNATPAPQGPQYHNRFVNDPSKNLNMSNQTGQRTGFDLQGQRMKAGGGYYNGKKVSFYANGGYHSGTITNYNASTGDFDLA